MIAGITSSPNASVKIIMPLKMKMEVDNRRNPLTNILRMGMADYTVRDIANR